VSTVDGSSGGTMDGNLTLRSTAAAEKDVGVALPAQLTLISLNGDTIVVGPADQLVFRATNSSGAELMSATISGPNGPVLGIADPGGNIAEHSGTSSSYYGNSAKDGNALVKRLEIGESGISVYDAGGSLLTNVNPLTGGVTTSGLNISPPLAPTSAKSVMLPCGVNAPSLKGDEWQGNVPVGNDNDLTGATGSLVVGRCNTIGVPGSTNLLESGTAFGLENTVLSNQSFVSGQSNFADKGTSNLTIFGTSNTISTGDGVQSSIGSSILGGQLNFIYGPNNTIMSGNGNRVTSDAGNTVAGSNNTIAGGNLNRMSGTAFSFIAGGERNIIDIDSNGSVPFNHGVIGGGADNRVSNNGATVNGGYENRATGWLSTIGGGNSNQVLGTQTTVGGGVANIAGPQNGAVVAGGEGNTASGQWSMVPGGISNVAAGDRSLAAGSGAGANHDGAFVWSDMNGAFSSTADNQFLIQATGNVGINTNSPSQPLTVAGTIYSTSGGIKFPDGSVQSSAATSITDGWTDDGGTVRLTAGTDNVGIGTSSPTEKLHVDGNLKVTGTITSGTSTISMDGVNEELHLGSDVDNRLSLKSSSEILKLTINGSPKILADATATSASIEVEDVPIADFVARKARLSGSKLTLTNANTSTDTTSFGPDSTVFDRKVDGTSRIHADATATSAAVEVTDVPIADSVARKARLSGSRMTLTTAGAPTDTISFGPNGTVFDHKISAVSRIKATATSSGANFVMKSSSGGRLIEIDGSNSPSTVHKNSFGSDSSRVSASSVYLGSDIGSSALSGGHMDFYSSTGSNAVAISNNGNGIQVYNANGNERVRIDATGIRGDSSGSVALEHLTPGGTKIYTNAAKTAGAQLTAGSGSWSSLSDVNSKENVEYVNVDEVLEKISKLDVASWNYKSQDDAIRHIGPMAQDIYALFGYGEDERHISTVDADGIALAAIKALHKKTQELESQKSEIDALRNQIAELKQMVESMSHQR
jgi:hypothetical protein